MKRAVILLLFLSVAHRSFTQTGKSKFTTDGPKTLRETNLPRRIKDEVTAHLYTTWFQSPSDPPYLIPKEDALNFVVFFPRLAQNGQQIILLQATGQYAGATGNGQMWFFLRSGDNVRLILDTSGFLFYPSYSYDVSHPVYRHGFRNLAVGWNTSNSEGGIQAFRFNGSKYVSDHCAAYTMDDNDRFHFSRRPCQTQPK